MSNLVENLLDLAREDVRRRHTELVPVDLASLLRDLCPELAPAAAAKGLTLTADIPHRELRVLGEATELRRLFVILIDNATKYTESGSVTIALASSGAHLQASVTDTGIGIDDAALPHVFDRFWRADKVRSRAEGGAGLGLALASQIVQRHNGSISVQSVIGQGSTFLVQLPLAGPV
jgi:signal transduction histidine kinase